MSNFSSDESPTSSGTFVIEHDPIGGMKIKVIAVISSHPVRVQLGDCVRALRLKCRRFVLGRRSTSKHFARRSLIETCFLSASSQSFQNSGGTQPSNSARVPGRVKADRDVGLRREVIDLVGFYCVDELGYFRPLGALPVVQ